VKLSRITSAALIGVSMMALAACGGEDATTAKPAPATTTAATPLASEPAEAGTTGGVSDKELCESVKKAGDDMTAALVAAVKAGEPTAADYSKILTGMAAAMDKLAATGTEGDVLTAIKKIGAESATAAAAGDPTEAASTASFEKAGAEMTAACKKAGVKLNF
jgi:hypothetical protein